MKSAEWQENLAHASILQAVRDYRDVRKILRKYPEHDLSLKLKAEVEEFFLSSWFTVLTNLDGKALLKKLQEE